MSSASNWLIVATIRRATKDRIDLPRPPWEGSSRVVWPLTPLFVGPRVLGLNLMKSDAERNPESAQGDWFIDKRCRMRVLVLELAERM